MMILRKSGERDTFLCHTQFEKRGRERNEMKKNRRIKREEAGDDLRQVQDDD